jgi:hypothetical protein
MSPSTVLEAVIRIGQRVRATSSDASPQAVLAPFEVEVSATTHCESNREDARAAVARVAPPLRPDFPSEKSPIDRMDTCGTGASTGWHGDEHRGPT